ncbi:MAG: riboflavin kinase, partial [Bacteroidota bacterium]
EKFLVEKFQPKHIVIGYDHRFGLNRQGDINYLKWHTEKYGFEVVEIEKQEVEELAISSTKIRKALQEGDIGTATALLHHYFTLTGTVVHGQKIGTDIGFPTANLETTSPHKLVPPTGIYAVYVWHGDQRYEGMLYIGNRPTISQSNTRSIEVNIFDFDKDIYGDKLRLEFVDYIRANIKFDNLQQLQAQLQIDKVASLQRLKEETPLFEIVKKNIASSVAVVILNYNGRDFLGHFLPSVQASNYENLQIYVADNGSTDSSLPYVQSVFPDVRIIDLGENHGFANGYNLALQQIESDYYILLNSDVEVTPDWINPIVEIMDRDATIAACQPKILSYQRKEMFEHAGAAGGWLDQWAYPFCRGRIFTTVEVDKGQYNQTQEIFWASGAALCIRAKLFHAIGGFDKDFFAHMEEIDLCWRLKNAGYKIMIRPQSIVYHVGGGTLAYGNPRKTYLNFRNSLHMIIKNETRQRLLWLVPLRLILDGVAGILFLCKGQFANIWAIVRAHWSFFPSLRHARKRRAMVREVIEKTSISTTNLSAVYPKSIIWQYYFKRKKRFKDLRE